MTTPLPIGPWFRRVLCAGGVAFTILASGCGRGAGNDAAPADIAPSVLVSTVPAGKQRLPQTLTLYGEMAQDVGASENVSFARPVVVARLMVTAGERVRAGQPMMDVTTDPAAAAAFEQAQSAVVLARHELASQQQLFAEKLATQSQLAAARKALADAQSNLSAQQSLAAAPGHQIVRARQDAIVASLSVRPGDRLAAGTAALQLSTANAQRALLGAEPEEVNRLKPGMPVRLAPVFGNGAVSATVSQVFAVINPQTRLVDVAVRTGEATGALLPGMKVRGDITLDAVEAWAVPHSAVLVDQHGAYVFQVAGGHARRIPVRVAVETPALAGVLGALDPRQPIVTSGNYELDDGTAVRVSSR